jgi:hypothetical protein
VTAGGRTLPMFLAGLLLLVLGGLWSTIAGSGYLPRFVFIAGALLLALFFIRNAGAIRYLLGQARAHAEPGPTTTLLLLALVIGLGALLAARVWLPVDLTAERLNSLSSASRQTLAQLQAPLRIEGYFADPSNEWTLAQRLFTLYKRGSRSVDTSLHDPDREPARAREAGVLRTGAIVVASGAARVQIFELSEEAITQAILSVLEGRPRQVGLVQGHGEPAPSTGGDQGITAWMQELATANVQTRAVRLLEGDAVPEDLDALLIVAPRTPLFSSEIGLLRRYLGRGGRIGVWAEPQDSTGLEELLGFYYLRLLPGTIRDEGRVTAGIGLGPWSPALVGDPRNAVTAGLASFVVASGARALEIETPHPMDLTAEPILKTAGVVDVFADPQATGGPPLRRGIQTVGATLEWSVPEETASGVSGAGAAGRADLPRVEPKARILVLGDASMLTNRFLGTGANRDLAVSAVHWLTAQEHFLDSARERSRPAQLRVGAGGLRTLLYTIEFGLPALLIGAGIAVWLRRRGEGA